MDEQEQQRIFTSWLNAYKGIFFKIVRAYAFTQPDQADLFQEISLQVWKSVPDFRGDAKVSTWIYRIALYCALAWSRQEKKQPDTQPLDDYEQILRINPQPEDERLSWLYEQIAQLDPIDRSVCLLLLDGFRYGEIAELINISETNVGVRIHRVKQQLIRKAEETRDYGI